MNIFVLDRNIRKCARYHCDQHVVKMILESAQMMCTCLRKKGMDVPYRPTHAHHPCVLWLEQSYSNFRWLNELAVELNAEYRFRYEREIDHASMVVIREIEHHKFADVGLTAFAQAMPEKYRIENDPVSAYRTFYIEEKMKFATWKKRSTPAWIRSAASTPLHQ